MEEIRSKGFRRVDEDYALNKSNIDLDFDWLDKAAATYMVERTQAKPGKMNINEMRNEVVVLYRLFSKEEEDALIASLKENDIPDDDGIYISNNLHVFGEIGNEVVNFVKQSNIRNIIIDSGFVVWDTQEPVIKFLFKKMGGI